MKRFRVKFRAVTGEYEFIEIDAASAEEADGIARFKGLWPEEIHEVEASSSIDWAALWPFGGVSRTQLFHFTRLFATLTRAGIPILETLELLMSREEDGALKECLANIVAMIKGGSGLHQAFSDHPKVFDKTYLNLVKVGEDSGELYQVLERLANLIDRQLRLRRMIRKALAYPLFVLGVSGIVTWGILTFIVPRFRDIYSRFGVELPDITQFVLAMSDLMVNSAGKVIIALVLTFVVFQLLLRTDFGRRMYDYLMLSLPVFGTMNHNYEIAQFAKAFSILAHSGVTVLAAMDVLIPGVGRVQVREALAAAEADIRSGRPVGESFAARDPWLPELFNKMVSVGERTGNLSEMLDHVAEFYEEEFNNNVEAMASLIEPMLMVFLGVIIGGIVVALYLPIFSLAKLFTKR